MPEGPSLRRWCSMTEQFLGRTITRIAGSSKTIDKEKWSGACLEEVEVFGKQLFLHLKKGGGADDSAEGVRDDIWIRCHFLMWGSVRVNEFNCKPSKSNRFPEPRLVFYFSKDEFLVFYGGSFLKVDQPPRDKGKSDILSDEFDTSEAVEHILEDSPICFTLLDQSKFAGLGNIIKNEVLYYTGTHPMRPGSTISSGKATEIVECVVSFSKRWLDWKMEEKHLSKFGDWTKIYKKSKCPRGHDTTKSMFGPADMQRITYWCPTCQPVNGNEDSSPENEEESKPNICGGGDGGVHQPFSPPTKAAVDEASHSATSYGPLDDHSTEKSGSQNQKLSHACPSVSTKPPLPLGEDIGLSKPDAGSDSYEIQGVKANSASPDARENASCKWVRVIPPDIKMETEGTTCEQPHQYTHKFPRMQEQRLANPSATISSLNRGLLEECCPVTKKIKHEPNLASEHTATSLLSLSSGSGSEPPATGYTSHVGGDIPLPLQHEDEEESTRISVSLSTIRALMKRSIRVTLGNRVHHNVNTD